MCKVNESEAKGGKKGDGRRRRGSLFQEQLQRMMRVEEEGREGEDVSPFCELSQRSEQRATNQNGDTHSSYRSPRNPF